MQLLPQPLEILGFMWGEAFQPQIELCMIFELPQALSKFICAASYVPSKLYCYIEYVSPTLTDLYNRSAARVSVLVAQLP
jgi:hypothetical protein